MTGERPRVRRRRVC